MVLLCMAVDNRGALADPRRFTERQDDCKSFELLFELLQRLELLEMGKT